VLPVSEASQRLVNGGRLEDEVEESECNEVKSRRTKERMKCEPRQTVAPAERTPLTFVTGGFATCLSLAYLG
jgi:hypothetical protein